MKLVFVQAIGRKVISNCHYSTRTSGDVGALRRMVVAFVCSMRVALVAPSCIDDVVKCDSEGLL